MAAVHMIIVLERQYGHRDVMWKRSINMWNDNITCQVMPLSFEADVTWKISAVAT